MPKLQRDLKDCGVSCLAEIIDYHKGYVPIEQLRDDTKTSTLGTNAYWLVETLKKYKFAAYGMRIDFSDLLTNIIPKPLIAHLVLPNGLEHFVVVKEINKKYIKVMDPAFGNKKMSYEEFQKVWDNIVILALPISDIPKFARENIIKKTILNFFTKHKLYLFLLLILIITLSLLTITINLYPRVILEINELNNIIKISFLFLIIFISKTILEYIVEIMRLFIKKKSLKMMLKKFLEHIINLPLKKVRSYQNGEVLTRVEEIEDILDIIIDLSLNIFLEILLIIIASFIIGTINRQLLYFLYSGLLVYLLLGLWTSKKSYHYFLLYMNQNALWKDNVLEELNILSATKHLQKEEARIKDINIKIDNKVSNYIKITKSLKIIEQQKNNYLDMLILFLNFYGIVLYAKEKINILDFITFQNCYIFLVYPLKEFIMSLPKLYYLKGVFTKINEYLSLKEEENVNGNAYKITKVSFQNVSYSYNGLTKVINNCSFTMSSNFAFLKGNSGCGKSTILKLLIKEIDDYSGQIKINDQQLNNIPIKDIRKNIVYLSQQETIISASVKDNILFHEEFDEERLNKVIEVCELDSLIASMPFKLDTLIHNFNLSGGEKARIILARFIYKKASMYLLDEPLSEVSEDQEIRIICNLQLFLKDSMTIYISHKEIAMNNCQVINL